MALANYDNLLASMADWLNRSDLTSVLPDFIAMAEAEFNRELRVREMAVRTRAPISGQYVKLPDDFLGMRNIDLLTDPVTPLQYKNLGNLDAHRAGDSTGKPLYYSIMQNSLEFAPVPDSEYTVEIIYFQEIRSLAGNSTNWLLTAHPDLYLYGSLAHSSVFLQDDKRIAVWAGKYNQVLESIKTSDEKAKFSGSTPSISFNEF